MKREILFRAITTCNHELVYGDLIHGVGKKNGKIYILPIIENFVYVKTKEKPNPIDGYEVIPETVGQFTGLTDTKNNNRKIFEGDIYKSGKLIGLVEWNNTLSQFQLTWQNMPTAADIYSMINLNFIFEYIGNIHENPELVK